MKWFMSRTKDERGVALLTAVMISSIVMVMGITAVQISVHNSDQSARDRRRVESIGSAEAGLDYYFSHLQDVSPSEIECSVSQALTGSPTAEFTVTAEYFDAAGDPIPCPMTDETIPDSALITSEGTTSQVDPTRTVQSFVYLIPKPPKPFGDQAIFSDGDPTFNSNVTVFGGGAVNADIYTNGDVILTSNVQVEGSVFAQGKATVEGNAEIKKDVWANGSVSLTNQSVVRSNVISSTSFVSLTQQAHVYGNAQAATSITVSGGQAAIDGLRIANTPSDPPPQRSFPTYSYDAQDWIDAGYTVTSFSSCTSARTFLQGITSGKHAVRITSSCDLQFPSNSTWMVQDDIAVISNGALTLQSNARIENTGGPHKAHLIFGLGEVSPCDITFNSNSDIADDLTALFYTPCNINMNSNSFVGKGQMFGGTVNFNSNATLYFELIPVPGLAPDGFDEDITFIREVQTT
ncbi:MAG TPA: hypothetical protein VMP42_00070 [Actinomycetota bacterium]|nr:hypothetical protein [Actinomycetota bacterium]